MEFASLDLEIDGVQLRVKVGRDGDGDGLCDEDGKGNGVPCAPGSGVTRTALAAGNLVDDLEKLIKPAAPKRSTGKPKKDSRSSRILAKLPYKPGDKDRELRSTAKYRGQELEFSIDSIWDGVQKKGAVSAIKKFLGFDPDDDGPEASTESRKFLNAMRERVQRRKAKEISQATPRIAITPEGLLAVLKDGRFKTQFESGTSEGVNSPIKRRKFEDEYLGIPTDLPDSDRPVYGYMPFPDEDGFVWHPYEYGEQIVVLKPDVRSRTTMTFGDSLDGELTGVSIDEDFDALPADRLEAAFEPFESAPAILHEMTAALDASDAVDFDLAGETSGVKNSWDYVEAQFHGGISLEDIEKVGIDQFNDNAEEMALALEANGIPWFFVGDEDETIQTWPKSEGGRELRPPAEHKEIFDNLGYIPGQTGAEGPDVPSSKDLWNGGPSVDALIWMDESSYKGPDDEDRNLLIEKYGSEEAATEALAKAYEEEVDEVFEESFADRDPLISVIPEAIFGIAEDGRYKNSFETKALTVSVNRTGREWFERNHIGVPSDAPPEARPTYGFSVPKDGFDPDSNEDINETYGTFRLFLVDEIWDRITTNRSDSAAEHTFPFLWRDRDKLTSKQKQNALGRTTARRLMHRAIDRAIGRPSNSERSRMYYDDWNEFQVHGGVQLSDIAKIGLDPSSPEYDSIKRTLDKIGMEYFDIE
jgi:hypothetical protein